MAKSRIVKGLEEAAEHARVHRLVCDWIRDDLPIAAKVVVRPEHIAKLVDRITGVTTHFVEVQRPARRAHGAQAKA